MDLQNIIASYGAKWAWARTGALILFLVTGILLVASLTTAHASHIAGSGFATIKPFSTAG
jgi:hypothetical protein